LNRIAAELEAKGYKLINRAQNQITFQGEDSSVAVVNVKTECISLDLAGKDSPGFVSRIFRRLARITWRGKF